MNAPKDFYPRLIARLKKIHRLESIGSLLGWDEQVNLPPGGVAQRAEQIALVTGLFHDAAVDPEIGVLLSGLEGAALDLSEAQVAVVREARRNYDRCVLIPRDFAAEKARLGSRGYHVWAEARAADDFSRFAPILEKQIEMSRQEAALVGWESNPYDYLIDRHDPGMTQAEVERLFGELREGLIPLAGEILGSASRRPALALKGFDPATQRQFLREVTGTLGFDYRRGRIDVSLHPFCSGTGSDIRMTTRFDPDNPLDSLFSSIHEAGHGMYEQGLPEQHYGTALGEAAGMAIHESQSRLWENQVGRSRSFWKHFEPRYRALFADQLAAIDSESLYREINRVHLQPIRVDADEVTYNLHILLRFELEKGLFDGSINVADLPQAWRRLSTVIVGLNPETDREGVLQDVHWSGGAFGYFPSYTLGNMIAAQFWDAARDNLPDLEEDFARGEFSRLLEWLREKVHGQGKRYSTGELVRRVTGEDLSARPLIAYLRERYLS